jgi:hypothetical protein
LIRRDATEIVVVGSIGEVPRGDDVDGYRTKNVSSAPTEVSSLGY